MWIKDGSTWKKGIPWGKVNGSWKKARRVYMKRQGVWDIVYRATYPYHITQTTTDLDIVSQLEALAEDEIEVIIDKDVLLYSSSTGTPALTLGASGKKITLINKGRIVGAGGSRNGGNGGTALKLTSDVSIDNQGSILGGGGGGGKGGTGGKGKDGGYNTYTQRTEDTGLARYDKNHRWNDGAGDIKAVWDGTTVYSHYNPGMTSFTHGGWTYYRGNKAGGVGSSVYYTLGRRRVVTDTHWHPTSGGTGGTGGDGGYGQGYNYNIQGNDINGRSGSTGRSGGQGSGNGGHGGHGGNGGDWGSAGSRGSSGDRGGSGGSYGAGGGQGGKGGAAVEGASHATWITQGYVKGSH